MFTRADFDVAGSAETKSGGEANLMVFGVDVTRGGDHMQGYANRISFQYSLSGSLQEDQGN